MKLNKAMMLLVVFSAAEMSGRDRVVVAMPKRNGMGSLLQAMVAAMACAIVRPSLKSVLPETIVQKTFQAGTLGNVKVVDGLTGLVVGIAMFWFDQITKEYFKDENNWELFFLDQIEMAAATDDPSEQVEEVLEPTNEIIAQIVENGLK